VVSQFEILSFESIFLPHPEGRESGVSKDEEEHPQDEDFKLRRGLSRPFG
jgi:hypothetical protein